MTMPVEERKRIVLDFMKRNPNKRFTNQELKDNIGHKIDYPVYMTRYTRELFNDKEIKRIEGYEHQYWYNSVLL